MMKRKVINNEDNNGNIDKNESNNMNENMKENMKENTNKIKSGNKNEKKSKFKRIMNIIEYIVIFLVIFVNTMLIIKSTNDPNKTPDLFGKKAFIIVSGSMIPTIQIGDIVFVDANEQVETGDIIAFRRNTSVIVHRVIKSIDLEGNAMFQTKGDNNNAADLELVTTDKVEGVYQFKIPYIGKLLMFLYNNLAIVIVIVVVILLIKNFLA